MPKGARIDFDSTRPPSPFLKDTHDAWRRELRRFIEREIIPHVEEWEEAGEIPLRSLQEGVRFRPSAHGLSRTIWRHLAKGSTASTAS